LLKTGFFGQVRELKIQRKNPGSALRIWASLQKVEELKLSFKKYSFVIFILRSLD
jgi:hypothetical protein